MRPLVRAVLLAAALVAAPPARAAEPPLYGWCEGYREGADAWVAAVVVLGDAPASGSVTCTVQDAATHGGTDRGNATSAETPGVAVLPPTELEGRGSARYVCTSVRTQGTTYYRDAATGGWSPSPSVACDEMLLVRVPTCTDVCDIDTPCLLLPLLFPPNGDVPGVWDCPPYDG